MPQSFSSGNVSIDLTAGQPQPLAARPIDEATPLRILVIGDFSGRGSRGAAADLSGRKPVAIDRDDFDTVFSRLQPALQLTLPAGGVLSLRFQELDDFEPDRLFERVELFASLRSLRRRLQNSKSFEKAAAEVRTLGTGEPSGTASSDTVDSDEVRPASDAELLGSILGQAQPRSLESQLAAGPVDWDAYVRDIVAPFVVPRADPRQAEFLASVDEATGEQMRGVLHHPRFQELESLWRGMFLLTRRLETGRRLKLSLLDLSRAERNASLADSDDSGHSALARLLHEHATAANGGQPWGLLLLDHPFGPDEAELDLLNRTGRLGAALQANVVAAADASLVAALQAGDERHGPVRDMYSRIRQTVHASWLTLTSPRFLLRMPYGGQSDPTAQFSFEEVSSGLSAAARNGAYLWGSGAFAIGCLTGMSFSRSGWGFRQEFEKQLDGLPVHVYEADGEKRLQTPAEQDLTTEDVAALWNLGLTALVSAPDQDVLRVPRIRSISAQENSSGGIWGK